MRRTLAVFMVVLIIFQTIATSAMARQQKGFIDLPKYQNEIGQLVDLGIINGYANNTFKPNLPITRLQAVNMLAREMKLDTANRRDPGFKDIKKGHPGFDVIAAAVAEGVLSGKGEGLFDPQGKLTRGEMAKILAKAYKLQTPSTYKETFKDVPAPYWAHGFIKAIAANKITTGYGDGTFRPGDDITRLQFSLFMSRYINHVKKRELPPTNPDILAEKEVLQKAFSLTADVEKPYYYQDVKLSVKYLGKDAREYTVDWKASSGKLTPAADKKSAVFNAQQNVSKSYTVTATIETKLSTGEGYSFDKTIVVAIEKLQDTPADPGPTPVPVTAPSITGKWEKNNDDIAVWTVNWATVSNSKGYKVYKSEDNKTFTVVKTINDVNSNRIEDYELDQAKTYFYKVTAFDASGESQFSNSVQLVINTDTDNDRLKDYEEAQYGTNPEKVDTDGDGLLDYYEIYETQTNPIKKETGDNGIDDGQKDLDQDTLTNKLEQDLKTSPQKPDTDLDGLNDGEEVRKGTNPLKDDTDEDGLYDGEEEAFGFNPTLKDTDGDGTVDGDEQVEYTTLPNDSNLNEKVTPSVKIQSAASEGSTTTITNLEGDALLTEEIPGYIGPGFEFMTAVNFTEAEMTFTYDESVVTDNFTPEIFYFNEQEQRLERLGNQIHDPAANTVTTTVTHFSKYILLNGTEWDKVWEKEIRPPSVDDSGKIKNLDVVFSIDSSGSMGSMDRNELRKEATKNFVDALRDTDRAAVVDFDSYGRILISLTTDKEAVKMKIDSIDSDGGTNLYQGVVTAIDELKANSNENNVKYVIFLTDGDGSWNERAIGYAKENDVVIYTIGLGSGVNKSLLQRIATETGGKYFYATAANELEDILKETAEDTVKYTLDEDLNENGEKVGDGIPDYLEVEGLRNGLGILVKTDPKVIDTDQDGLKDGEEYSIITKTNEENKIYFIEHSNPLLPDTDEDGIIDGKELLEDRMIYDFTHKHAIMLAELAYVNMETYTKGPGLFTIPNLTKPDRLGKEISDRFSHGNAEPGIELEDWYLIKAEDSHFYDSGFGAFAVKHDDKIVISYRGSDKINSTNLINDWLLANRKIFSESNNKQAEYAKEFAAEIILDNPNAEVYVVGHSLGGFLAQVVSYHLEANTLDDIYSPFWSKKKKNQIKETLSNGDYYKFTRTFNAAPLFHEEAMEELGAGLGIPSWLITKVAKDPAIPLDEVSNNRYDRVIFNYTTSWDFLHLLDKVYESSEKIGSDTSMLEYMYKDKKSSDIKTLGDIIDNKGDTFKAHGLVHFYKYVEEMKSDEEALR